eukprot:gene10803-10608_t
MPTEAVQAGELFDLQGTILPRFAQSAELRGMALGETDDIVKAQSNGYEVCNFVVTQQPVAQTAGQQPQARMVGGFYHLAVPLQEQVAKHKGYAFQWFTMSAVLVLLTLFFLNKGRITILLVFLTCALPIAAAFYLYFFDKPEGTNNYGTILDPQVNVSTDVFKNINGDDFTMQQVADKWVLIQVIN